MSIAKYVLLAWYAINVLMTVAAIGKPKQPITPGVAAISLFIFGGLCWLVVIA